MKRWARIACLLLVAGVRACSSPDDGTPVATSDTNLTEDSGGGEGDVPA